MGKNSGNPDPLCKKLLISYTDNQRGIRFDVSHAFTSLAQYKRNIIQVEFIHSLSFVCTLPLQKKTQKMFKRMDKKIFNIKPKILSTYARGYCTFNYCLLVSSAHNLCKQIEPRSGPTK